MHNDKTVAQSLREVWRQLSIKRKGQFSLLAVAMVVMSGLEIITLGAVLPFLGVLTVPDKVFAYSAFEPLWKFLDISDAQDLILPMTVTFCASAIVAGMWRLMILFASTRFAYAVGADFGAQIMTKHLRAPYDRHLNINSGDLLSAITMKINHVVNAVIFQSLAMMVSLAICIAIAFAMLVVSTEITVTALVLFGVIYSAVFLFERRKLIAQSIVIANNSASIITTINEAVGGIKEIILYGLEDLHRERFRSYDLPMRRAQAYHQFVGQAPRYAIEAMGMVVIAIIAYQQVIAKEGGMEMLAVLGTFALGAQRLLPAAQQVFAALTSINGGKASLEDVLEFLDQPSADMVDEDVTALPFRTNITLDKVGFDYDGRDTPVLDNISLSIKQGECIGIIGETGSGKSTLLAILMGLLEPTRGHLLIDDVPTDVKRRLMWRKNICHVPQSVFLTDGSIRDNITLAGSGGSGDENLLASSVKIAQLEETISRLGAGLSAVVGERGARVSGGELQRIGIARAIYRNRNVLVLDEATSSLDINVEQKVMEGISAQQQGRTIIIVAHRLATLKRCDRLLKLEKGAVTSIDRGSAEFNSIVNQ